MSGFLDSLGNEAVAPLIDRLIRQGQAFGGTSGKLTLVAAGNAGVAVWNPAGSGKLVCVYGVQAVADVASAFGVLAHITASPGWTAVTVLNKHRTSAATPGAVMQATNNAGVAPAAANTTDTLSLEAGKLLQVLPELAEVLLPPGTGMLLWLPFSGATSNVAVNLDWLEF
jgi:hypothetical protein